MPVLKRYEKIGERVDPETGKVKWITKKEDDFLPFQLLRKSLYQHAEQLKKWNGHKNEVGVLSEAQNKLLNCKIEKVAPETYPCRVLIQASEAAQ